MSKDFMPKRRDEPGLHTLPEQQIVAAIATLKAMGKEELDEAIAALEKAKDKVSDYVDSLENKVEETVKSVKIKT